MKYVSHEFIPPGSGDKNATFLLSVLVRVWWAPWRFRLVNLAARGGEPDWYVEETGKTIWRSGQARRLYNTGQARERQTNALLESRDNVVPIRKAGA